MPLATKETYLDKLFQRENVTAIRRLMIGGLISASTLLGIPALIMTGVGSTLLNATVMNYERKIQKKRLLNFYCDEIASSLHKAPDDLTLEDLKTAAAPKEQGGLGMESLRKELGAYDAHTKFRFAGAAVSSAITVGTLITVSLAFPAFLAGGLTMIFGLGLIGFAHTLVAKTVKATSQAFFGAHDIDNTVHQRLMDIGEGIKEQPVSPIEIFGIFAECDKKLGEHIEKTYKTKYADMPLLQKKQVVESLEPQLRIIALTDAINEGQVKPSLVGMLACGDATPDMPGMDHFRHFFEEPVKTVADNPAGFQADNVNLSEHRKRILAERAANTPRSLH